MDLKRICVFAVVSLVFVMIFCRATSPLYDSVGFDSIIYRIMGQRVALGDGVIYSELFDNKGPYLFMIQALGFIIDKEWGIMLLQVLNFIVILELLYRIGRFMGGNTFSVYMSLIVTVLFLSFTIDSGNLTEDWSMAFMLYPLYLLLRDIGNGTDSYQRDIALSGVCFGVVSLIRVNNGYIIGCIILYYIIFEKEGVSDT